MKIEAVVFDVDGTVVDSEELHRQAYNQTFLEFGFGWNWDAGRYAELLAVSGGQPRIAHYIDSIDVPPAEKLRLRRIIPTIHKEKSRFYGELIASTVVHPRPGVKRVIEEAHSTGARVGLVASSARDNVETLISTALGPELCEIVSAIARADMVARKKPAPDVYELILTLLRVSPAATVAFEDSANGLLAAKAVGLYTIVTPTRWTMSQNFGGADLVLSSLGDAENPLNSADASKIGAPYLELAKLETLRSTQIQIARSEN